MGKTILYVSCLCSKQMENNLLKVNPGSVGLQAQKYHRLLAEGMKLNGVSVTVLTYNKAIAKVYTSQFLLEEEVNGIRYMYLIAHAKGAGRYLQVMQQAFIQSYRFLRTNPDSTVMCDVLNFSVSMGALLAAKLLHRKIIGIVTDFPEMLPNIAGMKKMYWWLINHCTEYVLLTEAMCDRVCVQDKKYIVLEGHVDGKMSEVENSIENKWPHINCVYAGMLHKKYGIENLVKAFQMADVKDAYLHIYGDGDYAEELKKGTDDRIIYHGIVPNEEVVNAEIHSTLLINPRPSKEEFTKYSFPSKNMEYMASGTPVLTTDLPGMPKEYKPYIYVFEDETVEGMASTLQTVLSLTRQELHQMRVQAKSYVLANKTNQAQAKRILSELF